MKKYTISKVRFLEWYFNSGQDDENKELRIDLANSIINQMFKVGHGSMSVNELFDNCNQDAIRLSYLNEFSVEGLHKELNREYSDIEISDLTEKYKLSLVD